MSEKFMFYMSDDPAMWWWSRKEKYAIRFVQWIKYFRNIIIEIDENVRPLERRRSKRMWVALRDQVRNMRVDKIGLVISKSCLTEVMQYRMSTILEELSVKFLSYESFYYIWIGLAIIFILMRFFRTLCKRRLIRITSLTALFEKGWKSWGTTKRYYKN